MPDLADGASVEVQGSGANKYTLKNVGGVYSCSCPAWRNAGGGIERRTCKHLKAYRGEAVELERCGQPASAAKPKKAAGKTSPFAAQETSGATADAATGAAPTATEVPKADGPPLLLAHSWATETDPTGWWMSEKLDGVRSYWDGKQMWSRLGNPFHVPDWFLEKLPPTPLDGELFGGRKKFQQTVGLVKRQDKSDHWKALSYVVFDAPALDKPFEERLAYVRDYMKEHAPPYATAHPHERCTGVENLKAELARVEALGGEGLMLRKPESRYEVGRSYTLLKVKTFFDTEAKVVGHEQGKGKHKGRLGSLLVEMPSGTRFSVGTGLTDKERDDPPPLGTIITYRYQELSTGGVPRFPSYIGVKLDAVWPPVDAELTSLKAPETPVQSAPEAPSPPAPKTPVPTKTPIPESSYGVAWRFGETGEPSFPETFEVTRKAVLQVTDIKTNRNKYYCIELHTAGTEFRVFTHYGRTDDLDTNPGAGAKETRYFPSLARADAEYNSIYKSKTSGSKGYKEVSLASSKIGSQQSRGQSVGEVDAKTLEKLASKDAGGNPVPKAAPRESALPPVIQDLVRYIYAEATDALTKTVNAKITANGIETPLGVLTIGQVEKGEKILEAAYEVFQAKSKNKDSELERLTGEFYSAIPHRIGRTRTAIQSSVISTLEQFEQKQETLQLMKDMLSVNGASGQNVLLDPEIDKKFAALHCEITAVEPGSSTYLEMESVVLKSQIKHKRIKVKRMFSVKREAEWKAFTSAIENQRLLFHGSRIKNWVGILSRGLLTPKIVVSLGVNRTDAGWLGSGIYFGDAACTSAFYTTPGSTGTRLMAIHRVALGKMKDYDKITYGITEPPSGYHSTHGVRNTPKTPSQFEDDEYVVYDGRQQRQEILVEFTV